MDACPQKTYGGYPWQATMSGILRNLKDESELANTTNAQCHQPVRKKLTTEALVMIFVILAFVIFTLIRSAVSVYESHIAVGKETISSIIERKEDGDTHTKEKKKSCPPETSRYAVFMTKLRKFLDCFCIKSNARRILNTVSTDEQLCSLHGIRSIVLIWDLLGHISAFYGSAVKTPENLQPFLDLQLTYILKNAIFIVDAFLVLSGFLNGYFLSQLYEKRKGKIPWLLFYVHRFVRIIPLYFIVLGFYSTLFSYLGSGPVWPTYDTNPVCQENWMWNVLFLNNFVSHKELCLTPTWYLSCEMQLYIISPIFLVLLMRRRKIGYVLIALGICGSCFINFLVTKQFQLIDGAARLAEYYSVDLKHFQTRFWTYYEFLYSKPYARLGTYLIGLALGFYLYERKSITNKNSNQLNLTLGWIMAAIFMWISIFALHGREESVLETAVYNGLKHILFSFSVAWIIFVCVTGQGGFVNKFLSSKIFIVISRLSYTTYLTHLLILKGYFLSMEDLIDHSVLKVVLYCSMVFWIIPAAFLVSLIFEAPIIMITGLFFRETIQETIVSKRE